MLPILIAMLVVLAVAACVVTYVAFPHRGEELPGVPWLGDVMSRATDAMPLLEEEREDEREDELEPQRRH